MRQAAEPDATERLLRHVVAIVVLALSLAWAQPSRAAPDITFSLSSDEPLTYPASIHYLPDEHTTIVGARDPRLDLPTRGPPATYDFWVAMANEVGGARHGDAFVLQTSDFHNFRFAPGFGDAHHGGAVFWSPHPGSGNCSYPGVTHFDEQYAAPGSVLQDPTLPPGNLIMIYEAEIHCPAAPAGMAAGWVSIGVARSSDGGRTWPAPVSGPGLERDWLAYGDDRYAGVTLPGSPPAQGLDSFYGDSLPSAFIDDMDRVGSGGVYIYTPYQFTGSPGVRADARIHIARARLDTRPGALRQRLHFMKWYAGGWTQEGRGGLEEGVVPPCGAIYGEGGAQISYNDALRRYMMTFVCTTYRCPTANNCEPINLSLYYSTATSLAAQDWTRPQLIENSTRPYRTAPNGAKIIDGGYPSFVSPGCRPGHLGLTGMVFLLDGDPLGERRFVVRSFTIRPGRPIAMDGAGSSNGCSTAGAHG